MKRERGLRNGKRAAPGRVTAADAAPAGFIEKTANEGMEEHHSALEQLLTEWLASPERGRQQTRSRQEQTGATDSPAPHRPQDAAPGKHRTGLQTPPQVGTAPASRRRYR